MDLAKRNKLVAHDLGIFRTWSLFMYQRNVKAGWLSWKVVSTCDIPGGLFLRMIFFLVLCYALKPGMAAAQNYPTHSIKLIVTSSAGGSTDVLARPIAEKVSQILGQSVVIDNVPGANTTIAARQAARSAPDGYTLFLASASTLSLNPAVRKSLPYDPEKDYSPVLLLASSSYVLAARAKLGVNNVSELVELAKKRPGEIKYGMSIGSPSHFAGLMLSTAAGIDLLPVPYKDVSQAMNDLQGGEVDFVFTPVSTVQHLIGQKSIVILGAAADERLLQLPSVPTLAEQGYKDVWAGSWYGIVVKSGTPDDVIKKLNEAFNLALKDPHVQSQVDRLGFKRHGGTSEQLAEFIQQQAPVYKKIAQDAKIQLD